MLIFVFVGFCLLWTYRPFIYENHIFDFHIADTLGNWIAVPAGVNFVLFLHGDKKSLKQEITKAVLVFILYEFIAFWGTFDYYDIMATIFSGIGTYYFMETLVKPH